MSCDITCIVTGHREGRVAVATLRSFDAAADYAASRGYSVQRIFCLDRPNELTRSCFEAYCREGDVLEVVDAGDQGLARNAAVARAEGRWTAFLDGDDLWSEDWLVQALGFLSGVPDDSIAHPEYNYFFEQQATIFRHIDQLSPEFCLATLRVANYWDALCVCPTDIYHEFPFYTRDLEGGWAYEDWHWNCCTLEAGKVHRVVPGTVLFKRRQLASQTIRASQNKSLIKPSGLSRYDSALYPDQAILCLNRIHSSCQ